MGIKIGDFDIGEEAVENRVRIMVLEQIVEKLANTGAVEQSDLKDFRSKAIERMQKEYPELGIEQVE